MVRTRDLRICNVSNALWRYQAEAPYRSYWGGIPAVFCWCLRSES